MHSRLLSNAPPAMMSRAALFRSTVSSTITGGLPGPAQIAFLPERIAALTTAGPPVMHMRGISSFWQIWSKESSVGLPMQQIRFLMPVSRSMASLNAETAMTALLAPPGCGLMTIALPAATMLMMLPQIVGTECVTGVIAPITP